MRRHSVYFLAALLLVGCSAATPEAKEEKPAPTPWKDHMAYQGPGGAGNMIQNDPVTPASQSSNGNAASAFPKGVAPVSTGTPPADQFQVE